MENKHRKKYLKSIHLDQAVQTLVPKFTSVIKNINITDTILTKDTISIENVPNIKKSFFFLSIFVMFISIFYVRITEATELSFKAETEIGFLSALSHKIQFSKNGTYFDYRKDGGQEVLFPINRFAIDVSIGKKYNVILLYQPLTIETDVWLTDTILVDNIQFYGGTRLLYNFPFYRISLLRNFALTNQRLQLGIYPRPRNGSCFTLCLDRPSPVLL